MNRGNVKLLLVVVLVSSGVSVAAPSRPVDPVATCVSLREKIFQCKEAFADDHVARVHAGPQERETVHSRVLADISGGGGGPLSDRQAACAHDLAGDGPWSRSWLAGHARALDGCAAEKRCPARVACMVPILFPPGGGAR
jgi:hypothetical protein